MNHNIRLGITGLRRTGKTVFLTSLIYQLCELGSEHLPWIESQGVKLRSARLENPENQSVERFPFAKLLNNLRQPSPVWPPPTTSEFGGTLRFSFSNANVTGKAERLKRLFWRGKSQGTVGLHLHDYPGEFLLDVRLLESTFQDWSAATLDRMRNRCPREADRYEQSAEMAKSLTKEEALSSLRAAYGQYVRTARSAGLEFIQPSMTLINWFDRIERCDESVAVPNQEELPFVPLPESLLSQTPLLDEMLARYQDHVTNLVMPFAKRIQRCRTQLVLVDVLRILRHGVVAYNDTRECISEILHAYYSPWRPFKGIKRVIFAATKADHATKSYRPNMTRLLDELISKAKGPIVNGVAIETSEWFTSVRATRDGRSERDGRPLEVLIGTLKGNAGHVTNYNPGVVPPEWPDDDEWVLDNRAYDFPEFEPQQLAKRDGTALPHLNLDRIIWKVLKGCF